MTLKIIPDEEAPTPPPCKGRFYRFIRSAFRAKSGRIVFSNEIRPLKSISCPGCIECWQDEEGLLELMSEDPIAAVQFDDLTPSGATVELAFREVSRDRETGYVEEWYYQAIEVKKEELTA